MTRWFPEHTDLYQRGWLKGIEVVNEKEFYPIVHQWAVEKKLTLFANSDVHDPIDFLYVREKGERRPLTLVFARERSLEGVREAFDHRRTATFYDGTLIGDVEHLRPLVGASLKVMTPRVVVSGRKTAAVVVANLSDLPFRLVPVKSDRFGLSVSDELGPRSSIALALTDLAGLETGEHALTLRFEVANVLVGPATPLVVDLPVAAFAWGALRVLPAGAGQWTIDCGRTTPGSTSATRWTVPRQASRRRRSRARSRRQAPSASGWRRSRTAGRRGRSWRIVSTCTRGSGRR